MGHCVVLVDDDPLQLKVIANFLDSQLWDLHAFEHPKDAIALFNTAEVNVIVTDERMPGMSGTELIGWVAKHHPRTKRIILTSRANTTMMLDAINSGEVFRLLTKPCDPGTLGLAVREALEIYSLQEHNEKLLEAAKKQVCEIEIKNRQLEEFSLAVSHNLNEPLRMVSRFCQLLKTRYGEDLNAEANDFLDYAVQGTQQVRQMISDLLHYAQLDAGARPFQKIDLNAAVTAAQDYLALAIKDSHATIRVQPLPHVLGDAMQWTVLFGNLISNAIKYRRATPPHIEISADQQGDTIEIIVQDNGIGISTENAEAIFEIFRRLHTHEEIEGTGIGLAQCRRIMELHNGTIRTEATHSEGSRFVLTLPCLADEPDRESAGR